jgi:hypothetical protein
MDMRIFAPVADDFSLYAPPENYELHGKQFNVTFNGGKRMTLAFPAKRSPRCVKIKDGIWLVASLPPEPPAACVLDLDTGLVTRAIPGNDGMFELSFGVLEGASTPLHEPTDDLIGNSVEWTLGVARSSVFRIKYEEGTTILSQPLTRGAPKPSVAGFHAVKITDTVYLQIAVVTCGGVANSVCLLSDFHRLLCAGCVFGPGNTAWMIGGHGRYLREAYPDDSGSSEKSGGAAPQSPAPDMAVRGKDLRSLSPFNKGSIHQYTPPLCFELAGKTHELIMDDGYDFVLHYLDSGKLEWGRAGEPPVIAEYKCMKADDTTYLLSYELSGVRPRVNHTFILDFENMLVTRIISSIGKNPRWPYLMTTEYEFGMIADGSEYKTYPRHGFTSDLIGNIAQWAYGSEMTTVHLYYCGDFYRLTHARDRIVSKEDAKENYAFTEFQNALPATDEPISYIKIKEGMYLISLTEKNSEKILGAKMGFRSNTLCFLQNYKRCFVVGRAFGTSTHPDGTDTDTHTLIGAYGRVIDATDDEMRRMLTDPNPYLV